MKKHRFGVIQNSVRKRTLKLTLIFVLGAVMISGCGDTHTSHLTSPPQQDAVRVDAAQPVLLELAKEARGLTIMVDPERARPLFKEILDTVEQAYPPTSRRVGVALNDYGAILNITGTPSEALVFHQRAVDIFELYSVRDEKAADDFSRALANLAETHVRMGQLKQGRAYYKQAYKMAPTGLSAHPDDIGSGRFPLLIAANWREFYKDHPEDIFIHSDFIESETARAEANRVDRFARAQSLSSDPDGAFKAWMGVLPAMQKAYPPRSRKVLIATGNRGAVLGYFGKNDQAKELQNINVQGSIFYGAEILEDAVNMSRKLGNLGWARARLNEMKEAEAYFQRDYEIVTQKLPKVNEELGEALRGLTHIANWRGDFAGAIAHSKAGLAVNKAAFGEDNLYTLDSWLDLTRAYSAAGLPQEAEATARKALAVSLNAFGAGDRMSLYLQAQLAEEMSRQGRYAEAKIVFDEVLAAERRAKGEYQIILVDVLVKASRNLTAMGRVDAGVLMAQEAVKIAIELGDVGSAYHTNALMAFGETLLGARQYEPALEAINQAITHYESRKHDVASQTLLPALEQKVRILAASGQIQSAQKLLAELIRQQSDMGQQDLPRYWANSLLEAHLLSEAGEPKKALDIAWPMAQRLSEDATRKRAMAAGLAQDAKLYRRGFEYLLGISVKVGDAEKTLWAAQQLLQSSSGRASEQAAYRARVVDIDVQAQLKLEADLLRDLTVAQSSIIKMLTSDPERAKELGRTIKSLEVELATVQSALSRESLQGRAAYFTPQFLTDMQKNLEDDEAVIVLAEGASFFHTLAITKTNFRAVQSALTADMMREDADNLRQMSINTSENFDLKLAHSLYKSVFPPEIETVLADIKHLKLAANGGFSKLPIAVLVRAPPENNNLENADWLIQRWSVATLASLRTLQKQTVSKELRGFLGIGAPNINIEGTLQTFVNLPSSRHEVETIAHTLTQENTRVKSKILLGGEATEAAISALDFTPYDIVLFSTHGLMAGEVKGINEPALILSASGDGDGVLSVSEIARLDIPADWIVLSACNTAAGVDDLAPGLTGLAQAFLSAGGRSLLASHWPVRDDVAAVFVPEIVRKSTSGLGRAEALRLSMLEMMGNRNVVNAAHPAVWAPFVLVGE